MTAFPEPKSWSTETHRYAPVSQMAIPVARPAIVSNRPNDFRDVTAVDLTERRPSRELIDQIGAEYCLRNSLVPWKRIGIATVIATSRPQEFALRRSEFPDSFGDTLMAFAPEGEIRKAVETQFGKELAIRAESRVDEEFSCRTYNPLLAAAFLILTGLTIATLAFHFPHTMLTAICAVAFGVLIVNSLLKLATAVAAIGRQKKPVLKFKTRRMGNDQRQLPKISIIVPMFREREIAGRLVRRLSMLDYPHSRLEILLTIEKYDHKTRSALTSQVLPYWMRIVTVPDGSLKTKPRALNYALNFCSGSIIGIYDAEDAPNRDQLHKVVEKFAESDPQVACLQGVLDFYNARTNWLSRCFTIEYAAWFRIVLPGLQRLGLVVPLGGTTLFFRRDILEDIGAWDAQNVTEDADLGIRLARKGYTTELLDTVTKEEANCRTWPWVRQRSRWLKGYAMTWFVHMKSPRALLRDLGFVKFVGFQVLFLGTLAQFTLAPFVWLFWLVPLEPVPALLPLPNEATVKILTGFFLVCEGISWFVSILAARSTGHKRVWMWVPTLVFYFPLATLAMYKAIWEMATKPFFWDKTEHGRYHQ